MIFSTFSIVFFSMSFILKKLLSVNFSLLYINNVFRFCFIGILLSAVSNNNVINFKKIYFNNFININ